MKDKREHMVTPEAIQLDPFRIRQALVGLEMKQTDEKLLQYVDFLSRLIPMDAAAFIHLLPSYALFSHLFRDETKLVAQQEEMKDRQLAQMQRKIVRFFRPEQAVKVTHEVRIGDPLAGLLEGATEHEADLMLVGQKINEGGHGVLPRKVAGLLQSSALVVPQGARHSLRKILVPIDFSVHARKALETAIQLRAQLADKPTIICCHVFESPIPGSQDDLRTLLHQDQEQALANFIKPYIENGYGPFHTVLLEKELITRTGVYLLEYARENEVDLVVLGARGLSPIERMIMGSVTERFLSVNDYIPTLIVK